MTHKNSFLIIIALVFLLPLFFIPGGILPLSAAKAALAAALILVAGLIFLREVWLEKKAIFPRHYLLAAAAILPLVYLLSAILATPTSLALLGYNLEQGTFGFILLGSALLLLTSSVFSHSTGSGQANSRILQALTVFFVSISIIAVFVTTKILVGGDFLAMGQFFTNMGNPLGAWTDLAMVSGLLSVFAALTLGMLPLARPARVLLYIIFALSTWLLVVLNFSTAFVMTLCASVLLGLYFSKVERGKIVLPVILAVVSLVFLINPSLSGGNGKLSNIVSGTFGVENIDVRPSFSATLSISKQVLSLSSLLGSGPNTFGQDWLIYRPANINATPFWALSFPGGYGFLPTQIATTGILGSAFWLAFIVLLLTLAVKAIIHIPESRANRFVVVSTLLLSVFLWAAAFFYTPSLAVLLLAFFFTGLFAASSRDANVVSSRVFILDRFPQHRFASVLFLGALALGALWFLRLSGERVLAAYHFQRATILSNIEGAPLQGIEDALNKAIGSAPTDRHYIALSRLNFVRAQLSGQAGGTTAEEVERNRAVFQDSLSRSITAARSAASVNPAGYENWVFLGSIYSAMVPAPLYVEGAYEHALYAYNEARKRNPNNPELPLFLAQLELNRGNVEQARSYIRNSVALKDDYADAYLALAQLEVAQGNTGAALASAERLTAIMPDNPGVHFEIGLLKHSSRDFAGAAGSFSRALELSPQYANAKYYLALSLIELDGEDEARILLEELLVTNPDNAELRAALSELAE